MGRLARIASWAATAAATVPPLTIAVLVARHARNVPWKDQWGLVPFMAHASRGELDASALWTQVNEHRIPLALVLQGVLAWATRWDVRVEAWLNVGLAGLTLLAIAGLVRRTVRPFAPNAAPWLVLVASLLIFSPAGGINWPWGSLNATYLAALFAAVLARRLATWTGTWTETALLVTCATAGALSFGAGVVLLVLLPLALLACPSPSLERRAQHALAAAACACTIIGVYLVGWESPVGQPRSTMHWDRLPAYARYVVTYVGGGLGTADVGVGFATGIAATAALIGSSAWLWSRAPQVRAALVPWWLLAGYSLANGALTAFGRLESGDFTALFVRYLPTASFLMLSAVAIATMAVATFRPRAGVVFAMVTVAMALPSYFQASADGIENMSRLSQQLDAGARCLSSCATASDRCLLSLCWSAEIARQVCPVMAEARIGPFAR